LPLGPLLYVRRDAGSRLPKASTAPSAGMEVVVPNLVQYSEWLVSAPVLFAIARVRFNSPPTNGSGTTFVLFFVGLTIYCLFIVALWVLIIVALRQGGIEFGKFNLVLGGAQGGLAQLAPLMAAFVLVAATHLSWVHRIVTVAQGGIRLVTVSRPCERESARGLIMTLSNPSGMQFTPASAPIVLRRVADKIPQLGFILPDALDYESYRQELETVAPAFGFFAAAPRPTSGAEAKRGAADEPRLSLVG
jgi:hypothetical protein